ncbi:MAG: hypothetical protein R3E68_04670 [Burkholderiaceae bacterium]
MSVRSRCGGLAGEGPLVILVHGFPGELVLRGGCRLPLVQAGYRW